MLSKPASRLSLFALLFLAAFLVACAAAHSSSDAPRVPTGDSAPLTEARAESAADDKCRSPEALAQPSWYHSAIGYEIFVRSFQDSDGDGIGDLQGVIARLDYINDGQAETTTDLGATLLWLMPTFPSPSYHGYDVTDYRDVNPDYGSLADMKELVAEAKKRGVKVLLDLVMNHTSSQHPWFLDSRTAAGGHRDWYVWSEPARNWPRPFGGGANTWHPDGDSYYYAIFWSGMPDLNYTTPAVREEMLDVARFWLAEVGIAGYRLDAVRYLIETGAEGLQDTPETLAWWAEFSESLRAEHPDVLLLGEAWAANAIAGQYHAGGKGLQLTFDFDLMESIVAGLLAEEPADIERTLCDFGRHFPAGAGDASFLSNHDLVRLAGRLKERPELMRLAAELLFTLPGMPMVYYGQEIGMTNGPTLADEDKRRPMQWTGEEGAGFTTGTPWHAVNADYPTRNVAAQEGSPDSLLNLYRSLIRLRSDHPALAQGSFAPLEATSKTAYDTWGFARRSPDEQLVVFVNFGSTMALEARVSLPGENLKTATPLHPASAAPAVGDGQVFFGDVPPNSLSVVLLK